jgi:hypothetical protein
MNGRFKLVYQPPKNNLLQENFEFAVHQYLDEREELLFENLELDLEIMREVGAFYRVLKDINTKEGLRPMPDLLKRMFYLKRDIYHTHRAVFERKKYSSRVYVK